MDEPILKFVKDSILLVIGKQWENLAFLLDEKKYTNEFDIAKKLNITINQARNLLYKLSDSGLVSSTRKKDKKKGWYTYFWKLETLKCLEFYSTYLKSRVIQINNQINSRETKQFYVCERCGIELTEEHALLQNFTCQECGDVFTLRDNSKLLKELKKNLGKFNAEIRSVEKEIEIEHDKVGKKREIEAKREAKKKSKARVKSTSAKRNVVKKPASKKKLVKKVRSSRKSKVSKKTKRK